MSKEGGGPDVSGAELSGSAGCATGGPADEAEAPIPPSKDAFDRAAQVMYGLILTIEGLWIADVVTHGAVSRALEPQVRRAQQWLRDRLADLEEERRIRIASRHVVFEAMTITQEEGHTQ